MFGDFAYFPFLKVSPSELDALHHLPNADKDAFLPVVRLRPWRGAKKFESVIKKIDYAVGDKRPIIVDVCDIDIDDTECKKTLTSFKIRNRGYENWVSFIQSQERFIPALQVSRPLTSDIVVQAEQLRDLGRGLVLILRRELAWELDALDALSPLEFKGSPLLVAFDYGQIEDRTDLSLAAATIKTLADACAAKIRSADLTFTIASSSFPSNFAEIHRETFRLAIRERQLFDLVKSASKGGHNFLYGDYASVFAGERGFSRGGAPRIDLPKQTRWVYHRKEVGGYQAAALAVVADKDWDPDLKIWGAERIKDATKGPVDGFTYAQAWTAVRIHLHLHQQANFGATPEALNDTDEEWID